MKTFTTPVNPATNLTTTNLGGPFDVRYHTSKTFCQTVRNMPVVLDSVTLIRRTPTDAEIQGQLEVFAADCAMQYASRRALRRLKVETGVNWDAGMPGPFETGLAVSKHFSVGNRSAEVIIDVHAAYDSPDGAAIFDVLIAANLKELQSMRKRCLITDE